MNEDLLDVLEDMGVEVDDTLERLGGDEELYVEYLKKFPDNQNIVNLRKAVDAKDSEEAMREVHTLKGVSLNLGMLPLLDVCMEMLLDFRAGKAEEAYTQIDAVEEAFQTLADAIRANAEA